VSYKEDYESSFFLGMSLLIWGKEVYENIFNRSCIYLLAYIDVKVYKCFGGFELKYRDLSREY